MARNIPDADLENYEPGAFQGGHIEGEQAGWR